MQPIDNNPAEDQGVEAFRAKVLDHLERQTHALEFMRGVLLFFTALFVIGVVVWIVTTLQGA